MQSLCPFTGGGICDSSSASYSATNCNACVAASQLPGAYCGAQASACTNECASNADCADFGTASHCDTSSGLCVACLSVSDCPSGDACVSGRCQPGDSCWQVTVCGNACTTAECVTNCQNDGSAAGQAAYTALGGCINAACPATNGGVCDTTAASYNASNCSACFQNAQSQGGACYSQENACRPTACTADSDCTQPGAPICDTDIGGFCVACTTDVQCPPGSVCSAYACQPAADLSCLGIFNCHAACFDQTCVDDCARQGSSSAQALYESVVACLDASCPTTGGGVCDQTSSTYDANACHQCDNTAETTGACVAQTNACVASCASNSDCAGSPGTPVCDTSSAACVQCLTSASCGAGKACVDEACVATSTCYQIGECAAGCAESGCVQECLARGSTADQTAYEAYSNCIFGVACPDTGGGVCDASASSYSPTACGNCEATAQSAGGACASQTQACGGVACSIDAQCSGVPSATHCDTASGACVQCESSADCASGAGCVDYLCEPPGVQLTCLETLTCRGACLDSGCLTACLDAASPAAQAAGNALASCVSAACPSTGGGVCDGSSPGFNLASCNACQGSAQNTGGSCAADLLACGRE